MNDLYLGHSGILGMKWGVRRYQNKDGSLTEEGKKRYRKLVDDNGNYTEYGLKTKFDKKVEEGVNHYIMGKKIKDPFVNKVINDNKDYIDAEIRRAKSTEWYQEQQRQLQRQHQMERQMAADQFRRQQMSWQNYQQLGHF